MTQGSFFEKKLPLHPRKKLFEKGAKYFAPDFFARTLVQPLSDNEAAVMGERVMWEQRKASPRRGSCQRS